MPRHLTKAVVLLKRDGFAVLRGKISRRIRTLRERGRYQKWIKQYHYLAAAEIEEIRTTVGDMKMRPLISILMPVYNTDEQLLRAAIESVRAQIYQDWELCIADDHSPDPHVRTILAEYAALDGRIKIAIRDENGHIAAASNTALSLVTGEYTALMDHDDVLSPLAMYFVALEISGHPDANVIYTDEDKIDENGDRYEPLFKPDWSPELLLGVNYINHLTVYRTSLLRRCGAFRSDFDGSQDYDLLLRATEMVTADTIRHIPRVLYHWRAIAGSVAYSSDEKPYAHDRARAAIREHLERRGVSGQVTRGIGQLHKVTYQLPAPPPKVIVIVHGMHPERVVDRLLAAERLLPVEIITAESTEGRVDPGRIERGNLYARLNLAADSAAGSVLCFLSSDAVDASNLWLETLVGHALQVGVGAVGPLIVDKGNKIISAGLLLSQSGVRSALCGKRAKPKGRSLRLDITQNVSAIPLDCLVIANKTFASVGGFDENLIDLSGTIDLCLRLAENGYRTVWDPNAEITLSNRANSSLAGEIGQLPARWCQYFQNDPYHNPNLSLSCDSWTIAFPPRISKY